MTSSDSSGTQIDQEEIEAGMDEMSYTLVDNGVMELPSSKPAAYSFVEPPLFQPEQLEEALDEHEFGMMTRQAEQREDGRFYCYADVVTDHYKKISVKVWNDSVRIYPGKEPPDTYEFTRIVKSIAATFGPLKHDPIDQVDADDE